MRQPRTPDTLPRLYLDLLMTPGRLMLGALFLGVLIAFVMYWQEPEPKGVWFGIGIFVFGWVVTASVTVRERIKRHTFDLILRTRFEPSFLESARIFTFELKDCEIVDKAEAFRIRESIDEKDVKLRTAIGSLLNFYEILSISVYFKDADEKIVKEYFYDLLTETYKKLQHFIPLWRTCGANPSKEAFVYLEWLYGRWTREESASRLVRWFRYSN